MGWTLPLGLSLKNISTESQVKLNFEQEENIVFI